MTVITTELRDVSFQVNSFSYSGQYWPSAVALKNGTMAVIWQSYSQDGSEWAVVGQLFDPRGGRLGSEFIVNSSTSGSQLLEPWGYDGKQFRISALQDGGFVAAWTSTTGDGSSNGVYAQRFNSMGAKVGSEFLVNSVVEGDQRDPVVAGLSDGGYAISWISADGDGFGIFSQRYDASGVKVGGEVQVNTATSGQQFQPAITALDNGRYVVTWRSEGGDVSGGSIQARLMGANGLPLAPPFVVNTHEGDMQTHPSVASLPQGGFIVVWSSIWQDGSGWGIFGQRYDADGVRVGSEFRVTSDPTGDQIIPQVSTRSDGSFIVSWQENDGSSWGIYQRAFGADALPISADERVNAITTGNQERPSVVALDQGGYLTVWYDPGIDGSDFGISGRLSLPVTTATGDASDNLIDLSASSGVTSLDGGLGADTMIGGVDATLYYVDNAGDVVIETANGGLDEIQSTVSLQMPDYVEAGKLLGSSNLDLTGNALDNQLLGNDGANAISAGAGNDVVNAGAGNDSIDGGAGNDQLSGDGGNDTIAGGAGNDTIDGGAGVNTLVLSGRRSDYIVTSLVLRDMNGFSIRTRTDAAALGNLDGTDFVSNIQRIFYAGETNPNIATQKLDEYSNLPDPGNVSIAYGVEYTSALDFRNDRDVFSFSAVDGQSVQFVLNRNFPNLRIAIAENGAVGDGWGNQVANVTMVGTGERPLEVYVPAGSWDWAVSSYGTTLPYSFMLRRNWSGTQGDDVFVGAGQFERLMGGDGHDSLTGGSVSDQLEGEAGNDTLQGGDGNDVIDGGSGANTVVFSGFRSEYTISFLGNATWTVTHAGGGRDGTDTLTNVQSLRFADQTVSLDDFTNSRDASAPLYTFGSAINGAAQFNGDYDWVRFDFADFISLPDDPQWLNLSLQGGGGGQRFRIIDSDGNILIFRNEAGQDVSEFWSSANYIVAPNRWGQNSQGGDFVGGAAWIQLYADWGWADASYELTISRFLGGGAGNDTLNAGTSYDMLDGRGGSDTLIGSDRDDRLIGGDGNDVLRGNAGNDYLRGDSGQNTIEGGAGADRIDASSLTRVLDVIDGGDGRDTLIVQGGADLSGATLGNLEVITSSNGGTLLLSLARLSAAGISEINNLTLAASQGTAFDARAFGGSYTVLGSTGNDTISTGSGANVVRPGSGVDNVSTGAGDDRIEYAPTTGEWQTASNFLAADIASRSYVLRSTLDGGDGTDTLQFYFYSGWSPAWGGWAHEGSGYSLDISRAQLSGIERLRVDGAWTSNSAPASIIMTAAQLSQLMSLEQVRGVTLVGGGAVDLAAFATKGGVNLTYGDAADYTILGGAASETIRVSAGINSVNAGAGEDTIVIQGKTQVQDLLDGAAGTDALHVSGGDVDLSGATITNVERIVTSARSLALSAEQWLAFEGKIDREGSSSTALLIARTEPGATLLGESDIRGGLSGSSGSDTLTGNTSANLIISGAGDDVLFGLAGHDTLEGGTGDDILAGGAGNDTLDGGLGFDTARFAGNFADYQLTPLANGVRVSGVDGVDLLSNVERLQFADVRVDITVNGAAEVRVNTYTTDNQSQPAIASLPDGGWIATWHSQWQDGSGSGIYGQRFDAGGRPSGAEFKVNTYALSEQRWPTVTALSNGGWVIAWQSWSQDGSSEGVYAQVYAANGAAVGSELRLNSYTAGEQSFPSIAALPGGGFVATWMSQGQDGSGWGVYARQYTGSGEAVGSEVLVNITTQNDQSMPVIAALAGGGWVITWTAPDGSDVGVIGQRFAADGGLIGSEFQVNTNTSSTQATPAIAALPDGGWVVTWMTWWQDGAGWGIRGQRYAEDGSPLGAEFSATTFKGESRQDSSVAALADGGFVVTWMSNGQDGAGWGVYGQRFGADGATIGSEFRINSTTAGSQQNPSVTGLTDGGWVVTWHSEGQDGSSWGIYSQRYTADGLAYGDVTYTFIGDPTDDVLVGDAANNTFGGGDGNDTLSGLAGNDGLYGGAGDDALDGGAGNDVLDGGTGFDTAAFTGNYADYQLAVSGSQLRVTGPDGVDTLTNVERLRFADVRVDIQINSATGQLTQTFIGDPTDDVLVGDAANNTFAGGDGNDTLSGLAGNDGLYGGAGDDTLDGGTGDDVLDGGAGFDTAAFAGNYADYQLAVSGSQLRITGPDGVDTLTNVERLRFADVRVDIQINSATGQLTQTFIGDPTDDVLVGDAGNNTFSGGEGNDKLSGLGGADVLYGDSGDDSLDGGSESDMLEGGLGSDNLSGGDGADILRGDAGSDTLDGGAGNDALDGGAGDDRLQGGQGNDSIHGGAGINTVVFSGSSAGYSIRYDANDSSRLIVSDLNPADGDDGIDTLTSITAVQFADGTIAVKPFLDLTFQVNTYTSSSQMWPSVTRLQDGSLVSIWQSAGQDGSGWGVFGQRFDASGSKLGSEFQVNTRTNGNQFLDLSYHDSATRKNVAALADGGFVVVWSSDVGDGDSNGAYGQRFDVSGAKVGAEFQINAATSSDQRDPVVTGLPNGGFAIAWISAVNNSYEIFTQRYSAEGVKLGTEQRINTVTAGNQYQPTIMALADGSYVVAWRNDAGDGSSTSVQGRIVRADGSFAGPEFRYNTYTNDAQHWPSLAALPGGGFVAVWVSQGQDSAGSGVFGQLFDSSGAKVGGELAVNGVTLGEQAYPQVSVRVDGSFVVVWQSNTGTDPSSWGIYQREFGTDGVAIAQEQLVNSYTVGAQERPSIVALEDGGYITLWHTPGVDGSDNAVVGRLYTPLRAVGDSADNVINLSASAVRTLIDGGSGADTMSGGTGNTSYLVDNIGDVVIEQVNGGTDDIEASVSVALPANVENLKLVGEANLDATGNEISNRIVGNAANNMLSGQAGDDTLIGNAGDDSLSGGSGDDTLDGGTGNDVLDGGTGRNRLDGGAGFDTVRFAGNFADYQLTPIANGVRVGGTSGVDIVSNVERLLFADVRLELTLNGAAETRVNSTVQGSQTYASLSTLPDGGWIVVWSADSQDGWGWGVYGQRFAANGVAIGAEFRVNTYTRSEQYIPTVTALTNGGWIVTWMSIGQDGSGWGVYGQRYGSDGATLGPEFQLNTFTTGDQNNPRVVALSDGGFVVTWMSNGQDGSDWGVYARQYSSAGSAIGSEFLVNSSTEAGQGWPAIAALQDGGWVVTWNSAGQDGDGWGVFGQRYRSDGLPLGDEFQVNAYVSSQQQEPSIAALANGGWIITWMSYGQDGIGWSIIAQRFASDGSTLGPEFSVATYRGESRQAPSVAALADGGFVITWMSVTQDGSGWGVYGQRFAADGSAAGSEFRINSFTSGSQQYPSVKGLPDGGWVVTWQSESQDGSSWGIYSQRYTADGLAYGDVTYTFIGDPTDDVLVGDAANNTFAGGDGNDTLSGLGGDDLLLSGSGLDRLQGGDGDDTLIVDGKILVRDILDGGLGRDTLIASDGQDYTLASIANIEALRGQGVITVTATQVAQLLSIEGLTVQIQGEGTELRLNPSLQLLGNASVRISGGDLQIPSTPGIIGSKAADFVVAGGGADAILTGRDADTVYGGGGNDTIDGGDGFDTLFGEGGNDEFVMQGLAGQRLFSDRIDGGSGIDTLRIRPENYSEIVIAPGAISNIEHLSIDVTGWYYSSVVEMSAAFTNSLEQISVTSAYNDNYLYAGLRIVGSGDNLSLNNVAPGSLIRDLELTGLFAAIDATGGARNGNSLTVSAFDSIVLGNGNDNLLINGDQAFSVSSGGGDDWIGLRIPKMTASIDGGQGSDTVQLIGQVLVDLTGVTFTNIETIDHGAASIILTTEQERSLSFTGSGAKFIKSGQTVLGTSAGDSFTGDGTGKFAGGQGDDTISQVETVVLSGNFADYDSAWQNGTFVIDQPRGSLNDGTDRLTDVRYVQFADRTINIDDAANSYQLFLGGKNASSIQRIEYDKKFSGKTDYVGDTDVYAMQLAPNSPIHLEASALGGKYWSATFFDTSTGEQIYFRSMVYTNWISGDYNPNMASAANKWLPVVLRNGEWVAYQGGETLVSHRVSTSSSENQGITDYAFTVRYMDDYAGSVDTQGRMDPLAGVIRGYVGDIDDQDWIQTYLIAGTLYEFNLKGVASGGGTLVDPQLDIRDKNGVLVATDLVTQGNVAGADDSLIFRAGSSGVYYLAVRDVAGLNKGSWTLTQQSLDVIPGNVSSTDRIDWTVGSSSASVVSEVNTLTDRDWFKIRLEKGITYDLRMLGTSSGETLANPQLSLRSATGILLAEDDNSGGGSDARVVFAAPESGWYFLDAGASGNTSKGTYKLLASTLIDDFSSDLSTTGTVQANGVPVSGLITFKGDSDWFKGGLSANVTYVIDVYGDLSDGARLDPLADPLLIVRDAQGNVVYQADDFGGSLDARAYFTPSSNGIYHFEIKSAFRFDIGAYQLRVDVAPPDDHGNAAASASSLAVGAVQSGLIGVPGDIDVFRIALDANRVYQFNASGLAGSNGTLTDPYLRVFDQQGKLVDFDNDGGLGNDAQFYWRPTQTGNYFVEVSSDKSSGMGSYRVSVLQRDMPADDAGDDLSTPAMIVPGETFRGDLLVHNDQDWFRIRLEAGEDYVFAVRASTSGGGTLQDPDLEVRNAGGQLVDASTGRLTTNEPSLVFTPGTSGDYYLVVKAANGQTDTGSYTLVSRAPDDHGNTRLDATAVQVGQTVQGAIQWSEGAYGVRARDSIGRATDTDEDWFSFQATEGQVLSFAVTPTSASTLSRPMVEIVDSTGRSVAIGDGLETNDASAIATFRAGAAGTYLARVIDGAGATGAYEARLLAGDASDEDSRAPVDLSFSVSGGLTKAEATARIGLPGDSDAFAISLQQGHNYRIETLPVRDGTHAPLSSASLSISWTAIGQVGSIPVAVSRQTASPSSFDTAVFSADADGVLSLNVQALDLLQTGQYKLRVVDLGAAEVDQRPDSISEYQDARDGVLAANQSQEGRIDAEGDADLFAIDLTPGNIYDFSVKGAADALGTLAQPIVRLLDSAGRLVSVGIFNPDTGRNDLAVSVFEAGRYYISVSAEDMPGNTGTFVLDTRLRDPGSLPADDISADSRSGVTAAPGLPATGVINHAADHDWFKVGMEAGKVYVIDILAAGNGAGGTLADSSLMLLDAFGNEIASDDNSGAGFDSHIQVAANATGDYFLDVSGMDGATGSYTVRVRELYSGIADPLRSAQWYLDASGVSQLKGQITGAGVVVGVVDDGIDPYHPDLQNQIVGAKSYDTATGALDGNNKIPYPLLPWGDFHGTAVAGIIAGEQNNETGIVGVAPNAEIASIRVKWTWDQITDALGRQYQFDVSNNSWGATSPFADNFNSTALTFAYEGIRKAVEDGRGGKGTALVFSAGNSSGYGDNTNYHNFQNAREVITVAALDENGSVAGFSTPGANVLVGAAGVNLLTTDRREPGLGLNTSGNYTNFSGTSAAAPVVSGVVALMLEANSNLGYRDIQQILAYSAVHTGVGETWKVNGASNWNLGGLKFNDGSGFGAVNAYNAVALARTWEQTDTAFNEAQASARAFGLNAAIPDGGVTAYTRTFTIDSPLSVEHVELGVDLRHTRLGDLVIELISPNGTVSTLLNRPTVNAEQPFGLTGVDSGVPTHLVWDFSSVQFWGEDAAGTWTVVVRDVRAEQVGTISSLSLRVYGENHNGNDVYVFTDEGFIDGASRILADEAGLDSINAAPVRFDMLVDLNGGAVAANGIIHDIADWTVIENAYTGTGADRLIGNAAANRLDAGSGDDTLIGGAGNDILVGGAGSDAAVFAGNLREFVYAWDPTTRFVTVRDTLLTNGDMGTDLLSGIERLVFDDGVVNLGPVIGNQPPVANATFFDNPLLIAKGMGLDFALPDNAFSDSSGGSAELNVTVSDPSGGELPAWLSYDAATRTFTGVPPADLLGSIKLKVTALDEFGSATSDILTLQFGDNQAPTVAVPSEGIVSEDAGVVALNLEMPVDPEGLGVTVTITDLPVFGTLLDGLGRSVLVGDVLTADEFSQLSYRTALDMNGSAGYLRYTAMDEAGVTAQSSLHIFVTPVNDAPRFSSESSRLIINYPAQASLPLDLAVPSDPESTITTVKVIDLPSLGRVTLDGNQVVRNQVLTLDQLTRLAFTLSENVNGPIGSIAIQATDAQGLATNWSLAFEVQGEPGSTSGTAGADALYGSIADDTLSGLGGNDTLAGNAGNDRLLGGLGNDSLFGGSGNDQLDGSSGNDLLDGGSGNDTMYGGPGNDTYIVDAQGDLVLEVLVGGAGGIDSILTSVSMTAPTNVENLQAAAGPSINLMGNALDNVIIANDANNSLIGGGGRDTLIGNDGDDTIDGGTGVDRLAGGKGNDTYYVDSRSDVVTELSGEGVDTVIASSNYTLSSNVENLILAEGGNYSAGGNSMANHIIGNSGNNIIAGGLGADTLEGGMGDDIYVLSDVGDVIIDTGGIDSIRSSLDVTLGAGIENIELIGVADTFAFGNVESNIIVGNLGNNYIEGGGGVDRLTGGGGADQFLVASNGVGASVDEITDFTAGVDLLLIDLASFGVAPGQYGQSASGLLSPGSFVKGAGATALDPNDYFLFDTAQGLLLFDPDASGAQSAYAMLKFSGTVPSTLLSDDLFIV